MICRNCNCELSGNEDYCPHCAVPLKFAADDEEQDTKSAKYSHNQELPDIKPGAKNTIFDSEPIYIYAPPESTHEKSDKSKKKSSAAAVAFICLFAITVFAVGAFVAAEYLGIVPAISPKMKSQTTQSLQTTQYTLTYNDADGIIAPDISYKPSLSFVSSQMGLSLRKGPADHYAQIQVLSHGRQVQIIGGSITESDRVYVYVPDSDLYGWLCSSFLTSTQALPLESESTTAQDSTDVSDKAADTQ